MFKYRLPSLCRTHLSGVKFSTRYIKLFCVWDISDFSFICPNGFHTLFRWQLATNFKKWYNKIITVLTALARMLRDCYDETLWHFVLSFTSWLTCRIHAKAFSFMYNLDLGWIMKPPQNSSSSWQIWHIFNVRLRPMQLVLETIWQGHIAVITQSNSFFSSYFCVYIYILRFTYSMFLLLLKI